MIIPDLIILRVEIQAVRLLTEEMEQPVQVNPVTNQERVQQAQAKQEEHIQVIVSHVQPMFRHIVEVQVNTPAKEDPTAVVRTALLVQAHNHHTQGLLHPVAAMEVEVENTEDLHPLQAQAQDILQVVGPVAVAAVALIRQVVVQVVAGQAIHQAVAHLVQVQLVGEDNWVFTTL